MTMIRTIARTLSRLTLHLAGAAAIALGMSSAALAAGGSCANPLPHQKWSFDGMFGTYDRAAAQRGFQVYKDVCAACHGLSLVAYRNLADLGLTEDQIKDLIKDIQIQDGPNDKGEMFERRAKPSDRFRKPYANDETARAVNNGALPPDLSLLAKSRNGDECGVGIPILRTFINKLQQRGPDYIHGVLVGYVDAAKITPELRKKLDLKDDFKLGKNMAFNVHFKGHQIAMPPPLTDGAVTYADGAPNTVDAMAHDVATFLAWAAEPKMEDRKRTGVRVVLFLLVLAGILYLAKRKIWAKAH